MPTSRREFLNAGFSVCSSFGVSAALSTLNSRLAFGETIKQDCLQPTNDETTGLPLLRLPEGFRYRSYGWTGDLMNDGLPTPPAHDGMGVVKADGDVVTLVRNHEVSSDQGAQGNGKPTPWDQTAGGGCTSLEFDIQKGEWRKSWLSFAGTSRNCAGGITPWGTWLTCEETVLGPESEDRYKNTTRHFNKEHGWIFEVHPDGSSQPVPLESMGRFVHEAVAIDHETGIVYETEDRGTSGFYRFVPNRKGEFAAGGELQIAEVVGRPDVRKGVPKDATFDVKWHRIDEPTRAHSPEHEAPDELGVFKQGRTKGGTCFSRLEGCWFGNGYIYFDATSGGDANAGQIWRYDPAQEKLTLLFESPDKTVLNMPDNLCVNPLGGLMLCEDNDYGVEDYPQRMFALPQNGTPKLFAQNNIDFSKQSFRTFNKDYRDKEWAGACFDPSGKWLFANLQTPGLTVAITGPWDAVLA